MVGQLRTQIMNQVQELIVELGGSIYQQVENAMNARIMEIIGDSNSGGYSMQIDDREPPEETRLRRPNESDMRQYKSAASTQSRTNSMRKSASGTLATTLPRPARPGQANKA